jgi:hypothetical protein
VYRILVTPPSEEAGQRPASGGGSDTNTHDSPTRPTQKAANVSLELGGDLTGLTLSGFSVWNNGPQGLRVAFPTRRFVASDGGRGSFLILRATDSRNRTAYDRLKSEILDAYHTFITERDAPLSATEAAS